MDLCVPLYEMSLPFYWTYYVEVKWHSIGFLQMARSSRKLWDLKQTRTSSTRYKQNRQKLKRNHIQTTYWVFETYFMIEEGRNFQKTWIYRQIKRNINKLFSLYCEDVALPPFNHTANMQYVVTCLFLAVAAVVFLRWLLTYRVETPRPCSCLFLFHW